MDRAKTEGDLDFQIDDLVSRQLIVRDPGGYLGKNGMQGYTCGQNYRLPPRPTWPDFLIWDLSYSTYCWDGVEKVLSKCTS